jgi:hypothetical protein
MSSEFSSQATYLEALPTFSLASRRNPSGLVAPEGARSIAVPGAARKVEIGLRPAAKGVRNGFGIGGVPMLICQECGARAFVLRLDGDKAKCAPCIGIPYRRQKTRVIDIEKLRGKVERARVACAKLERQLRRAELAERLTAAVKTRDRYVGSGTRGPRKTT